MTKVMSRFCASWTDTNAHAQEAFGGVSAMFAAVGMTKTADTGQMVLGSVVAQLSGGFPYYEMWTWTDTTGTIVMKWEYGVSSSVPVTQRVKFRVTFGTGSDGSGNVTGVIFPATEYHFAGNPADYIPTNTNYMCLTPDGALAVAIWHSDATCKNPVLLAFDRRRDATGAPIVGDFVLYYQQDLTQYVRTYRTSTGVTLAPVTANSFFAATGPVANSGVPLEQASMLVYPLIAAYPDYSLQPVLVAAWNTEANAANRTVVQAYVNGVLRTYLTVYATSNNYTHGWLGTFTVNFAMIWE